MTPLTTAPQKPPHRITLAFQGGGAIGAFQAGVLEALHNAGVEVAACSGSSIGAINAALYFGNDPSCRVDRLKAFWRSVSVPGSALRQHALQLWPPHRALEDQTVRRVLAETDQSYAFQVGLPGFFVRRLHIPWFTGTGNPGDASVFDTRPLSRTLSSLCDFELLNRSPVEVSVVAANLATGAARYFVNHDDGLDSAMIMASGALPPWFPAVEIDGSWYWDGSLVTGAPLRHLVSRAPAAAHTVILRADLWSCDGPLADNLVDVDIRLKNIQHASRAAFFNEAFEESQHLKSLLAYALARIDGEQRQNDPQLMNAAALAQPKNVRIVPVDYPRSQCEAHFKDSQFGETAIDEHWKNGRLAAETALSKMGSE
ncbi:patatin-like phospholipase family protein [Paraburkholderia sp.]|jgi:NTE family protein|uniref:patatin-like phospholipase family protein n=1 Tax=Paraburkholderia sp. TaxID=1926495 RepID=UPI002F3E961C